MTVLYQYMRDCLVLVHDGLVQVQDWYKKVLYWYKRVMYWYKTVMYWYKFVMYWYKMVLYQYKGLRMVMSPVHKKYICCTRSVHDKNKTRTRLQLPCTKENVIV